MSNRDTAILYHWLLGGGCFLNLAFIWKHEADLYIAGTAIVVIAEVMKFVFLHKGEKSK